jgi:hypothetical protein
VPRLAPKSLVIAVTGRAEAAIEVGVGKVVGIMESRQAGSGAWACHEVCGATPDLGSSPCDARHRRYGRTRHDARHTVMIRGWPCLATTSAVG